MRNPVRRLFLPIAEDAIAARAVLAADGVLGRHGLHGREHIGLAAAHRMGIEAGRRFHRDHREQLEHVVWHHVAQRAGLLVEPAAGFHAHGFGDGDLHVVDAVAVPDRLEHAVGETQRHDVLHRLLAKKMVDPIDLVFFRAAQDGSVQRLGRGLIMAEWLLDDHAAPMLWLLAVLVPVFLEQPGVAQMRNNRTEEAIGDRQVKQAVPSGIGFLVEMLLQLFVKTIIVQIAFYVSDMASHALPSVFIDLVDAAFAGSFAHEAFHHLVQAVGPSVGIEICHINADQLEMRRQQSGGRKIIECRDQQSLCQIAAGAENNHGTGVGWFGRTPGWRIENLSGTLDWVGHDR